MGASTYSTESDIEKQSYDFQYIASVKPTPKEARILEKYSNAFTYLYKTQEILLSHDVEIPHLTQENPEFQKSLQKISNKVKDAIQIYQNLIEAVEGFYLILKSSYNSGAFEQSKLKAHKGKFSNWIAKLSDSKTALEQIPFDFDGFRRGIYECILLLEEVNIYRDLITNLHVVEDGQFLIQIKETTPETEIGSKTEDINKLLWAISNKEGLVNSLFATNQVKSESLFMLMSRTACVVCMSILNNYCFHSEKEVALLFGCLAIIFDLCEQYTMTVSIEDSKIFPVELVTNTLLSLSTCKSTLIVAGCLKCIMELKRCQRMYSLLDLSVRTLFDKIDETQVASTSNM